MTSFELEDPTLVADQPAIFHLIIYNRSVVPVKVDLGQNLKGNFSFSLHYPDGQMKTLPRVAAPEFSVDGLILIESGGSYSQKILLNEWTQLDQIGKYRIEGSIIKPLVGSDDRTVLDGLRFETGFTVQSRDEQKLENAAEKLLTQLINSVSYSDAAISARALTYFKNGIATEQLKKALLARKMIEPLIIDSLRLQGDDYALDVFEGVRNQMPDPETAAQITSAIQWISRKGGKEDTRRRATKMLRARS